MPAAAAVGLETQMLRYMLCMFAAVPLGFAFRLLPNSPTLKHLTSIVLSLSFCTFALGEWQWMHSFFSATVGCVPWHRCVRERTRTRPRAPLRNRRSAGLRVTRV